ncbi:MAG TPA: hypothetical protein VFP00_08405 [Burkholderiales bacterium]|nr:hypothetical protein [Burkholderiales bacterium]
MSIAALWLPILVSAVIVFVTSALVWMVMPWHKSDFRKLPDEDGARAALRGLPVGCYMMPYCKDPAELKDEAVRQKFIEGPQAFITVAPNGLPGMTPKMVMSFVYYIVVGAFCAYVVGRTLPPDADYMQVFRVAGTTAFLAYGLAYVQDSIWFSRPWSLTAKSVGDALLYGLLTAGVFGWLA